MKMKKCLCIWMLFAVLLTMAACGKSKESNSNDMATIFLKNMDSIWSEESKDLPDICGIAVTDLDQNGRPELFVSDYNNTGGYTYSKIFEINENKDGIDEISYSFLNPMYEDETPDLWRSSSLRVYVKDGLYYYIADDYVRELDFSCYKEVICKKGTQIEVSDIASLVGVKKDKGEEFYEITLSDAEGNIIDADTYRNADAALFEGAEKKLADITWEIVSREEVNAELLNTLFEKFNISDTQEPDDLYMDPETVADLPFIVTGVKEKVEFPLEKLKATVSRYDGLAGTKSITDYNMAYTMAGTGDGNIFCAVSDGIETYVTHISPDGQYLFSDKDGIIYMYDGAVSDEAMTNWLASFVTAATAADAVFQKADYYNVLNSFTEEQLTCYLEENNIFETEGGKVISAHCINEEGEYVFYLDPDTEQVFQCSVFYENGFSVIASMVTAVDFPDYANESLSDDVARNMTKCTNAVTEQLVELVK